MPPPFNASSWYNDKNNNLADAFFIIVDDGNTVKFKICISSEGVSECIFPFFSVANTSQKVLFICFYIHFVGGNDHTSMTAPLPVCSAKLSMLGLG